MLHCSVTDDQLEAAKRSTGAGGGIITVNVNVIASVP